MTDERHLLVSGYSILTSKDEFNDTVVSIDETIRLKAFQPDTTLEITVPFYAGGKQFTHSIRLEFS